ncbi:MAG: metal ABC transporter permease [Dehalococcoidia bacterium]
MLEALLEYEYMRYALFAGLLASVACGIVGTYVAVKKMTFISGGISHASFGGIGLGFYIGISPVLGALIFALLSALGMGLATRMAKLPEDAAIGMMWVVGMALGILFIDLTPGYAPDLSSYLFGNILLVPFSDLVTALILDVVIILVVVLLYKEFLAVSFDEEFGTAVGVPTGVLYFVLLCLIALTVVVLVRVVGIILIIALLTMPPAMARQFTFDLRKMMFLSVLFGAVFTVGGLWLSYEYDVASGATIILFGGALFLVTMGARKLLARWHRMRRAGLPDVPASST